MELRLQKSGPNSLEPVSEEDAEIVSKMSYGEIYKVKIKKINNPAFHRKLMKLIDIAFQNQEKYDTPEHFRNELKFKAGWVTTHVRSNGEVIYIPKSMSFEDCDNTERQILYDRFLNHILKDFLGNMSNDEFMSLYGNFL